jgi:hypothetical protein
LDLCIEAYQEIVDRKLHTKHYIRPLFHAKVELLIGPFQSSLLFMVLKLGKVNKFHTVHNFSYPHSPSNQTYSINHTIDPDMYPCTWGTFGTICFTIYNLSPGSQASIREVAEAYRTIPTVPEQWPSLVVRLWGHNTYCINTNDNFGLASAGGIYGKVADATTDIFRAQGIGPLSRWVNDHIFFQIQHKYLSSYNDKRNRWHNIITKNSKCLQSGSCLWYLREILPDDLLAEFDEDAAVALKDLSLNSAHSNIDSSSSTATLMLIPFQNV